MSPFSINLLLAVVWATLSGELTLTSLLVGFVVGYLTLWIMQPLFPSRRYCARALGLLKLAAFFLSDLLTSSLKVARSVVTPLRDSKPGIVSIPIDVSSNIEITVLANLISLTPGSLSLDVTDDRKHLVVHAMYIENPDEFRREIKQGVERRVIEALRR